MLAVCFDFVADSKEQFVLKAIEVTTLRFSEIRAGGFFEKEAWYDLVLSPIEGKKERHDIYDAKSLVFSGTGRCTLRFWSGNNYPAQGWITGKGEYMIDVTFVFSVGGKQVSVSTGPFKIDV
jgi:hypothetical protein